MITQPLDLLGRLKKPSRRFDVVPVVDLILIAFFFTLMSSRFVFAPGLTIDLPRTAGTEFGGMPTAAVLTVRGNDMVLFEGNILNMQRLPETLGRYTSQNPEATLLVRFDRQVSVQALVRISEIAMDNGFSRVHVATETGSEEDAFGP